MTDWWQGRRVLITGIAGFVGANLANHLVEAGAVVSGLDLVNDSPSLRVLEVKIAVWAADVTDPAQIWEVIRHAEPEVVFHLAGHSHISDCQQKPFAAFEANVRGAWNVLEVCRIVPAGQIKAVVVASSNHVFGSLPKAHVPTCALGHRAYPAVKQDSARTMWLEDDPCGQTDVYGVSKGCVDLLTRAYGTLKVPVAALRHANCFGNGDPHRSHVVTGTICDLLEGKAPVIHSDGTPLKAYLHVKDVCQAYLIVAEALISGAILPGATVNAGGPPISVLALVDTLIGVAGVDVVPDIRGDDMSQSGYVEILDDSRLRSLGWTPRPLHEGLAETYKWYEERKGMAWLSL